MIRGLFSSRGARQPGWLAIAMQPGELHYAHGFGGARGQCAIKRCGTQAIDSDRQLERVAKELGFGRHQCLAVLAATDYQMLLVEAPNVPALELKTAVRWRIKDLLDYHVQDATIDVLDIPVEAAAAARAHSMYAIAARNEVIQACIERCTTAHIPLSVIDIAETAQRNIAALLEPPDRGLALLYVDRAQSLLTVTYHGELYLARRIDLGLDHLEGGGDGANRLLLELQRSLDHLDRQFPFAAPSKVVLAPLPSETGLRAHLAANLDLPVEDLRFADVLNLDAGVVLEGDLAWRLFHVLGASLRNETKAL